MNPSVRNPIFTGSFYPAAREALQQLVQEVYLAEKESINKKLAQYPIIGGIVPHAGYIYSGVEAIHFYDILQKSQQHFDTIVVVNPNHTGYGSGLFNTSDYAYWETPLGQVQTDFLMTEALGIESNNKAHSLEHSGEVQLPFLQLYARQPFAVVMITMNEQTVPAAESLAKKIWQSARLTGRTVLLIASSDFSHHESPKTGFEKDQLVIDQILRLETRKVYDVIQQHQVSACGYGPIMTLIAYAKLVTLKPAINLLRRGNSGEVNASDMVVDYASFLCYEA